MSAAFDRDPCDVPDRCDDCRRPTTDLCPLGHRNYCPKCYRIAIADLEVPGEKSVGNCDPWLAGE